MKAFSSNNSWNTIPNYGYKMRYNENIAAAYASYSLEKGPFPHCRIENGIHEDFQQKNGSYQQELFGSLSERDVELCVRSDQEMGSYRTVFRSIERPAFYTLNPNRIQISDYSYDIGNPKLRPTYIDNIQLTLVWPTIATR